MQFAKVGFPSSAGALTTTLTPLTPVTFLHCRDKTSTERRCLSTWRTIVAF
jgi:hypothetical protein